MKKIIKLDNNYLGFKILEQDIRVKDDKRFRVKIKCSKCDNIEVVLKAAILSKEKTKCSYCKDEGLKTDLICITSLKTIKRNAEKRNLEFNLTGEYLSDLFILQNKKCALTGIELNLISTAIRTKYHLNTASLDRINNNKGYIEGNVRWVHKSINQIKSDLEDNDLFYLCKLIVNFNNDKIQEIDINKLSQSKKRASKSAIENMIKGSPKKKPIIKCDLEGKELNEFDSINGAVRELKYKSPMGIIFCCKGKQKSFGGYKWKYK